MKVLSIAATLILSATVSAHAGSYCLDQRTGQLVPLSVCQQANAPQVNAPQLSPQLNNQLPPHMRQGGGQRYGQQYGRPMPPQGYGQRPPQQRGSWLSPAPGTRENLYGPGRMGAECMWGQLEFRCRPHRWN